MRSTRRRFISQTVVLSAGTLLANACHPTKRPPPAKSTPPPPGNPGLVPQDPNADHHPARIKVRIYMVPEAISQTGPGQTLTLDNRKAVEKHLRDVVSKLKVPLLPSSIIVVGSEPYSFTYPTPQSDPKSGPGVGQNAQLGNVNSMVLIDHDPNDHHETVLRVWPGDTVTWQTRELFNIQIKKAAPPGLQAPGTPDSPFLDSSRLAITSYKANQDPSPSDAGAAFIINSDIADRTAIGQQYKITITIGNLTIDPDIICGSPPAYP